MKTHLYNKKFSDVIFNVLKILFLSFYCLIDLSAQNWQKNYEIKWTTNQEGEYVFLEGGIKNQKIEGTDLFYHIENVQNGKIIEYEIIPNKVEKTRLSSQIGDNIHNQDFIGNIQTIDVRGKHQLVISVVPFRKNIDGEIERLVNFTVRVSFSPINTNGSRGPLTTTNSVLSNGDIYKCSIGKSGIYKIDKSYLESKLGINLSSVNPKNIKIYTNLGGRIPESNSAFRVDDLQEIPLLAIGEEDGKLDNGDYFIFYAEGADKWNYVEGSNRYSFDKNIYHTNNYIFIKIDNSAGLRIQKQPIESQAPTYITDQIDSRERYEVDNANLLGSFPATEGAGKEWYGDYFRTNTEKNYNSFFNFDGFIPNTPIELNAIFAGRSSSTTQVSITIGNKTTTKSISGVSLTNFENTYARKAVFNESITVSDNKPTVLLSYPSAATTAEGWLDYLQIVYQKRASLSSEQLSIINRSSIQEEVTSIQLTNVNGHLIWDISDPLTPVQYNLKDQNLIFRSNGKLKEFLAFKDDNTLLLPTAVGKIANQNVHGLETENMIIVYHPITKTAAERLAEHRNSHSKLKTKAVNVFDIYNEFGSGKEDPAAIRDMAKMLYDRNPDFRYLLLLGDGTYDYRNLVKDLSYENYIPVYETDESFNPIEGFASDDFYGLLSESEGLNLVGGLDISVGRLPAKNATEADVMVNKIIHYETSPQTLGDWKLRTGYNADDEDGNLHMRDMDNIAKSDESRHKLFNQQKVYFDAFNQVSTAGEFRYPDANQKINDNIFKGQLTVTYLGHGGPLGWAQERVLTVSDISGWTNYNKLPIIITATCSFAAYDEPSIISPAELALLNPNGGAVALFSTTRAVYTNSNKELTDAVHELLFKKVNGQAPRIGDVLAAGKNKYQLDSFFRVNSRKFTLLGDPSMQIALTRYNITTETINDKPSIEVDTIGALQHVTITGSITDDNGNVVTSFNGLIYPTVFDKKVSLTSLANDSGTAKFPFTTYQSILFKGSASVENGKWAISFWVPKNINYNFGNGRISYYATDGESIDASGLFDDFVIGSSSNSPIVDNVGPEIDLFMNNENFVDGGITDKSPYLLAYLTDDLGINVTGNAIGQDITAVLDGDNQNLIILNEFYTATKDDPTSGVVKFPFKNLSLGKHSLLVKAWDINGNSTQESIDFIVSENVDGELINVVAKPNPFNNISLIEFSHDFAEGSVDVTLYVYTVSGQLAVKNLYQNIPTTALIELQLDAPDIASGVYIYKIVAKSKTSNQISESGFYKIVKL